MAATATAIITLTEGELAWFRRPGRPRARLLETAASKPTSGAM